MMGGLYLELGSKINSFSLQLIFTGGFVIAIESGLAGQGLHWNLGPHCSPKTFLGWAFKHKSYPGLKPSVSENS